MEYVLLLALSILVAIFANHVGPRLAATSYGQRVAGNYAGRTLTTALVVFGGIVIASLVMSAVYKKPSLPSA